jgi:hypothetical protein
MPVTSTKQGQSAGAATTHKHTTTKLLSLNEVITKWRVLDDAKTVARLEKLLQQPACGPDLKPKPALSQSTMHEYTANLKVLQTRLTEEWSKQPRQTLPAYVELVLRPNGPKSAVQLLTDPAETRRVAICMASVVSRCFPNLDPADKERALTAWRAVLSQARKEYLQARDRHGGYGGFVDPSMLLTAQQIHEGIEQLPVGSADRCLLKLMAALVPSFPTHYRVNSPLLNLGHIKIVTAATVADAPTVDAWADSVHPDDETQQSGLLLVTEEKIVLYLLFDVNQHGPQAMSFGISSAALAAEVRAYLASLPQGMPFLFSQVKGAARLASKGYIGTAGRDSFNARINRILGRVYGECGGIKVTQTIFRLSLVHNHQQQWENACKA